MKLKNWICCSLVLLLATPLFAVNKNRCNATSAGHVTNHKDSLAVTQEMARKMLERLRVGKEITQEWVYSQAPLCDDMKELPQDEWADRCISDMYTADAVYVNDTAVPTVVPSYAFRLAAKKYFSKGGNDGVLNYKQMAAYYDQRADSNFFVRGLMDNAFPTTSCETSHEVYIRPTFAEVAFGLSQKTNSKYTQTPGDSSNQVYLLRRFLDVDDNYKLLPQLMNEYWSQATKVYNDKDTFYRLKWTLFSKFVSDTVALHPENPDLDKYGKRNHLNFLAQKKFWDAIAIKPTANTKGVEQVTQKMREVYNYCRAESADDLSLCTKIKAQAESHGFWQKTDQEVAQEVQAQMRGFVATQPRK